jgi:hypothetical protein
LSAGTWLAHFLGTEAPVGSRNANVTVHLPPLVRSLHDDRTSTRWVTLCLSQLLLLVNQGPSRVGLRCDVAGCASQAAMPPPGVDKR